jgi:hypothetical protein
MQYLWWVFESPTENLIVNCQHKALVQYDHILGINSGHRPSLTLLGRILNNTVDLIGGAYSVAALNPQGFIASGSQL